MKDYKQEYIRYKKMYLELKAIKEQQGGKQVFDGFKNMFKSAPTETPIESPVQMNPVPEEVLEEKVPAPEVPEEELSPVEAEVPVAPAAPPEAMLPAKNLTGSVFGLNGQRYFL